jgi:hypothetical protein
MSVIAVLHAGKVCQVTAMIRTASFALALPFAIASVFVVGCERRSATPASIDAGTDASVDAGLLFDAASEEVTSVYPELVGAGDPRAVRLCQVLHEVPEQKRAACCKQPMGLVITSECVRMLTGALRGNAVTLNDDAVAACATALEATYQGCDWVGPFPPPLPKACAGLITGRLPAGKRCRSSLECVDRLRCKGVGPTSAGVCSEAAATNEACGGGVDALASYVRDANLEREHPSCTGYCARFKCGELGKVGAECVQARDCEDGLQCIAKQCVQRAPSKAQEACAGGVCEEGLTCLAGKCTTRKAAGQSCKTDFECLGGCLKAPNAKPGATGKCGMRCDLR